MTGAGRRLRSKRSGLSRNAVYRDSLAPHRLACRVKSAETVHGEAATQFCMISAHWTAGRSIQSPLSAARMPKRSS